MNDAAIAAALFAGDPAGFGGIVLRGDGPLRDELIQGLAAIFGVRARRLARTVDVEALEGGLDLAATLATGKPVRSAGLLDRFDVLIVAGAERIEAAVAARLGQAIDAGDVALVLIDDGVDDEQVPASLAERCAFWTDANMPAETIGQNTDSKSDPVPVIAATALAFGVGSARAQLFAVRAARALGDVETAARIVLGPRATELPPPPEERTQDAPQRDPGEAGDQDAVGPIEDRVIEAVRASLPPDVIAAIGKTRGNGGAGAGAKRKSIARGRALASRAGMPRGGKRLALVDTLRAAAPWQRVRRDGDDTRVHIRKSDLRIKRFEDRAEAVTIFAVDASGSAAAARLGEAKGAVEVLLAEAYVKRTQVALIAFRGEGAELLLPPTRSLTRARRALGDLPGGGGTPLASGIDAARELAEVVKAKGRTPFVVLLTDGRGNIARDGTPGRPQATADAAVAAKRLAATGIASVCVDTAARPRPEAAALAAAMAGRYLALPHAGAHVIGAAVKALA
jgi:magnesium chelatase subunit D